MFMCKKCGEESTHHLHLLDDPKEEGRIMRELGYCWNCAFWQPKVEAKNDPLVVRVDGTHFWIHEGDTAFKGFGGHDFTIQFNDGRVVETSNLWCQGDIPEHFRNDLPDNAVFVQ